MKDSYKIDNIIENIHKNKPSPFLDKKDLNKVISRLKKGSYNIYELYEDSDYNIVYKTIEPDVVLIEIKTNSVLKHSDILGSIMSLNIDSAIIGDIVVEGVKYYFYTFRTYLNMFYNELSFISNSYVELKEVPLNTLAGYKRKYEECEIIVSSLRIDTIVSRIINTNRNGVLDKIKNKEIILNYDVLTKGSIILKKDDIFSIRKYGKYKFKGVVKTTKKDNFIIKYLKYK